jgi:hypothetical protein
MRVEFGRFGLALAGIALLLNLLATNPAWPYADAFTWKLIDGGPDKGARLKILGVFEDEASCRRAGVLCPSSGFLRQRAG